MRTVQGQVAPVDAGAAAATNDTSPDEMDPQKIFEELFGMDVRRARTTSDTTDDLELAEQLLRSANTVSSTPKLFAVICREAIALASVDMNGLDTVLKGIDLMRKQGVALTADDFPSDLARLYQTTYVRSPSSQREETGQTLIDVLLKYGGFLESLGEIDAAVVQFRRADTVARAIDWPSRPSLTKRITQALGRKTLFVQIEALKKRMTANPNDVAAANDLVYLYLIELNQPQVAVRYAGMSSDATLAQHADRATKPASDLTEADAVSLGAWYESMLDRAPSDSAKANVLGRLVGALDQYLTLHAEADLDRLKVKVKRDRFAEQLASLAKVDEPVAATPRTIDLGKLIDPKAHAERGEWLKQGSQIAQMPERKGSLLRIPVVPTGSYELTIQFTRTEGDRGMGFALPVGDTGVALYLRWSGKVDGLSNIDRRDVDRNPTTRPSTMTNDRRNVLLVRINLLPENQAHIVVTLNGTSIVDWKGARSSLTPDRYVRMKDQMTFGLNGWNSKVVYHSLSLRMLDGEAKHLSNLSVNSKSKRR